MKKSQTRKRETQIMVRVTEEEKNEIGVKAKLHGLKTPSFMRNLALNYPVVCVADQLALNQLVVANADLGRIGGLFKMWLSANKDTKGNQIGKRSYQDIDKLVDEIMDKQEVLLKIAQEIIKIK